MVVPHRGGDSSFSLRIPIKIIKAAAVALVCVLAGGLASFAHYQSTIQTAKTEQQELAYLRANREQQEQKLEQLSEYLKQPKGTLCYYYSPKEPYTITAAKNIFEPYFFS